MTGGFARGIAVFLAVVLVTAGASKLVDLEPTRIAFSRLASPRRPTPPLLTGFAIVLGGVEVSLGLVLGLVPLSTLTAAFTLAMCTGFVVVVRRARRRGLACGCFRSFSPSVAGPVEMARATALLGASGLMLGFVSISSAERLEPLGVLAGAILAAIATMLAMVVASPTRSMRAFLSAWIQGIRQRRRIVLPWVRRRLVRAARAHPTVRDVEGQVPTPLLWRRARVSLGRSPARVASIVVPGDGVRLQVVTPLNGGAPAAVCYTPTGAILPRQR